MGNLTNKLEELIFLEQLQGASLVSSFAETLNKYFCFSAFHAVRLARRLLGSHLLCILVSFVHTPAEGANWHDPLPHSLSLQSNEMKLVPGGMLRFFETIQTNYTKASAN